MVCLCTLEIVALSYVHSLLRVCVCARVRACVCVLMHGVIMYVHCVCTLYAYPVPRSSPLVSGMLRGVGHVTLLVHSPWFVSLTQFFAPCRGLS